MSIVAERKNYYKKLKSSAQQNNSKNYKNFDLK